MTTRYFKSVLERDVPAWKACGWFETDEYDYRPSVGRVVLLEWVYEGEPQLPEASAG